MEKCCVWRKKWYIEITNCKDYLEIAPFFKLTIELKHFFIHNRIRHMNYGNFYYLYIFRKNMGQQLWCMDQLPHTSERINDKLALSNARAMTSTMAWIALDFMVNFKTNHIEHPNLAWKNGRIIGVDFPFLACPYGCVKNKNKNTTWKRLYELDKQRTHQWTKTKWLYYFNKVWCKLNMKWTKNTRLRGDAFQTSSYIIKYFFS